MNAAVVQIRRLEGNEADASLYRDIRLEALKSSPKVFRSTFEIENAKPLTWFSEWLANAEILGVFRASDLIAVAGFGIQDGSKTRHKGVLWGMYVRPGARRAGVGNRLVRAILDLASERVELIQLTVLTDNHEARRLYAGLGFVEYGIEKDALKHDGCYSDHVLMAKDLRRIPN